MKVVVVIPVYNGGVQFEESVVRLKSFVKKHKEFSFVIVNDGSKDGTNGIVDGLIVEDGFYVLDNYLNLGKWASIRRGFLYAHQILGADVFVMLDADLSVGLGDMKKALSDLKSGVVVLGNRYGGVRANFPLRRRVLSWGFNKLVDVIGGVRIDNLDSQCPMKMAFVKDVEVVFEDMKEDRFAGDVEFLKLCLKKGLKVKNFDVKYDYNDNSTVGFKSMVEMFVALFRIRKRIG